MPPPSPINDVADYLSANTEAPGYISLRGSLGSHLKDQKRAVFVELGLPISGPAIVGPVKECVCSVLLLGSPAEVPGLVVVSAAIAMCNHVIFAGWATEKRQSYKTVDRDTVPPVFTPQLNKEIPSLMIAPRLEKVPDPSTFTADTPSNMRIFRDLVFWPAWDRPPVCIEVDHAKPPSVSRAHRSMAMASASL